MNGNVLPRTGIVIRFLSALILSMGLAVPASAAEKVTLCHGMVAVALIPLARSAGFYAEEGLEVQTRKLPSGVQALNAMLKGECQLAGSSLPATVTQSLVNMTPAPRPGSPRDSSPPTPACSRATAAAPVPG